MMIYNRWCSTLLTLSLSFSGPCHAERDPFRPPQDIECLNAPPVAPAWQLRGVVGNPGDYRAWLVSPQGVGRLWAKGQRPDERWQLSQLEAFSITLVHWHGCAASLKMMLKGNIYAKEKDYIHAGADSVISPATAIRQPNSVVSGIR
ncbi:DNA utilization family protein [Erwinia psidii]|uniref:DUF2531 family protein n=1 Tax=Erwinia psidii TaxID=69224 RepID=A0A3N6TRL9_9GAMM|nr:DNA utilization family protein [Erwinia psidii]MCX8958874.1 DUF2531 family protein [Erwinia psidii]MCX8961946.1 DUF2531 family protein [Erwinia psidii]MCX8966211.1 DUF2531 family protein [Erwinia psidii]RQM37882.1 DUF2531 family protein [Erwinia psidii]